MSTYTPQQLKKFDAARALLHIHSFLSDGEDRKVKKRLDGAYEKTLASKMKLPHSMLSGKLKNVKTRYSIVGSCIKKTQTFVPAQNLQNIPRELNG